MQKGYRFRIYPNSKQIELLNKTFGCKRFVYNHLLNKNIEEMKLFKKGLIKNKPVVNIFHLVKQLPSLKSEYSFLEEVSSIALQQVVIDLAKAFKDFFSIKGFPVFKSKRNKQSFRIVGEDFRITINGLLIPKCKTPIKIVLDRKLPSVPTSVTISKTTDGNYYASFVCESIPKITNGQGMIGIDLGLKDFCSFNDGSKIVNPKHLQKSEKKLKQLQRKLSKKQNGSSNRNKARLILAKQHQKIVNQRNDFLHKLSRQLVNDNQVIAIESLNIKGMLRNHSLAKAISSVSWSRFIDLLKYKVSESQWCTLIQMDHWFASTQICSCCSYRNKGNERLKLSQRYWICPSCDTTHDRDTNAAQNILDEALKCIGNNIEAFRGMIVKLEMESV